MGKIDCYRSMDSTLLDVQFSMGFRYVASKLTLHVTGPNRKAVQWGSNISGGHCGSCRWRWKAIFQTNDALRIKIRFRKALLVRVML